MDYKVLILYKKSKKWSILPVLIVEGYISHIIFQRALTAALFKDFIEYQVLLNCTPYLGPRLIIILNNASIHKSARL